MKKFSRKREAILAKLRSTTSHPTAEWIYAELKPDYPDLSQATVYRNLNEFLAEGEIISVGVYNGQEHFDGNAAPHAHFICEGCGKIFDVDTDAAVGVEKDVGIHYGFDVTGHSLMLYGRCDKCRQKERKLF